VPSRHRLLVAGIAAAAVVIVPATAAWAHVTIQPPTAAPGSSTIVSFVVPNEKDSADTTQVEVQFPTDHPVPSVAVLPTPGWTYKVTTTKLPQPIQTDDGQVTDVVSGIVWSGGTIKPGEFEEFTVSMGPLPDNVGSLEFKTLQTYSDGDVVRWIEDTPPGGPEPDHPAPTLTLTKSATTTSGDDDSTARLLAIVAIAVGVLGVLAGAAGLVAARRARS
jgi:uncharacterized protein YcnI